MKCVFVSSPLMAHTREGIEANRLYATRCTWDSIKRGEAPFTPHLFYTVPFLLDDLIPHDRELGLEIGMIWGRWADLVAVYTDKGISSGMQAEIDKLNHKGIPVEFRSLDAGKQT